jgi:cycloartenol synthase
VYDWSGNNPIFPELWLAPQFLPFHPGIYLPIRMHPTGFHEFYVFIHFHRIPDFESRLQEVFLLCTGKFWCLCRMVYLPMAYLYGKKFVGPITPTILSLRKEIYDEPYHMIDWGQSRNECAKVCSLFFVFIHLVFFHGLVIF